MSGAQRSAERPRFPTDERIPRIGRPIRARVVLGIDPGLATLGYGVIADETDPRPLAYGCLTTPPGEPLPDRLRSLFEGLASLRDRYAITDVAMESLFVGSRLRALSIGEARGAAIVAVVGTDTVFREYGPSQVKESITGYGKAAKRQVQEMVRLVLGLQEIPKPDDAADALAVALCHMRQLQLSDLLVAAGMARP
ncbi:MAG TPA: crossover junction endodeoxyribonuclease RuvC [Chloroflexota bacterium]